MDEASKELALIKNAVNNIDLNDAEKTMETLVELTHHIELLVAEVAPEDPLWGFAIWANNRAIKMLRSL